MNKCHYHPNFLMNCFFIKVKSVLLTLIFISLVIPTQGQQGAPKRKLSQYVIRSWNTEDGLTSESISELAQTDDGYIWIGTFTGLHRFDGKSFTVFTSQNSDIPSSNVLRVKKGYNGELWLGTLHGISIYKDGAFFLPESLASIRNLSIEEMLLTRNGDLWFSTKSNSLYQFKDNLLKEFTQEFEVQKSTILAIEEDKDGNIYFGTDDSRLLKYSNNNTLENYDLNTEINGINTIVSNDAILYLGTGNGLFIWENGDLIKHGAIGSTTINTIIIDDEKALWLGTMNGLFRHDKTTDQLDSLTEESGMPSNIVDDIIFDSQGNLWVGTYRNGFFYLGDGTITSFTKSDGLATNIITSVSEIQEDTYLLGNENGTLNLLKNGNVTTFKSPVPIPTERLKNIFTDSKGRIWISTYGGLVVIDGNRGRQYQVANGFPDNFIRLAFEDRSGNVWVGTKNAGLLIFESLGKWNTLTIDDGLTSNYIMSIEQLENGDIIVGTISGLNVIRDGKVIKTVTVEDGLPSNFLFATHSTSNFTWIASNDGLTGINGNKIINFNTENGMPSNIIYDVMSDDMGNLWMPSENAILSVKIEDLETAANDPDYRIQVKQYGESYGMKNSHCLGAVLSFEDSRSRFWIPTIGGIVLLDPDQIRTPTFRPNVLIENIYADNKKLPLGSEIIIPPKTNRLSIDFTGISYTQTDLLQFRYRLSPFDNEWVDASPERNAIYTNLAPGSYVFEVQTWINGSPNRTTISQELSIAAAWWQTGWARVLMILAIILIALLIYWIRMRALRSNNLKLEEIVKQRTKEIEEQKQELRITIEKLRSAQEQMIQSDKMASLGILAAGVAHEINNPLNFIQGGVEGLEQNLKKSKKIKDDEYVLLISAIKEGISRASTIVSSLNEFSHASEQKLEPCDIYRLIENCLTMIRYRLKNGIELEKEFPDTEAIVLGNNGKLHQAFLNIITNSIQAIDKKGTIRIEVEVSSEIVIVDFIDSGQGIKPEHLSKITEPFFSTKDPGKGTGLGLSITYSIINEHNGTLKYSSEWGKGTTARITLPLMKK